ncbi:hypothetical protein SDC9_75025 [bioreactor metagenome]|uniref:Uncharacterized protein n=1 Tax=bioreactor metagenome TaxID=1076179 RepID=A0A644YJI3_9ZZZZ
MVVALHRPVDGEVLLDDLGAAGDGGDRHVPAALVTGVADRAGADLGQPAHVGEVQRRVRRGIGGLALQQRERHAGALHEADGLADLRLGGHAGRQHHRQAVPGGGAQQGVVGQVGGGDLERRDAVRGQRVQAGDVPRRAHHVDVAGPGVVEDLVHLLGGQREPAEQIEGVLRAEVLPGGQRLALVAIERRHVAQLELDDVGAGVHGEVDQLLGQVDRAVVVVADLGDDDRGGVGGDPVAAEVQLGRLLHGDRDQPLLRIDDRDVGHPGPEQRLDVGDRRAVGDPGQRGVRHGHGGGRQVRGRLVDDPAAEVAVGEGPVEVAVLVDAEDLAGLVGGDLLQGGQHRVLGEDDVRGELALDDHAVIHSGCER